MLWGKVNNPVWGKKFILCKHADQTLREKSLKVFLIADRVADREFKRDTANKTQLLSSTK